MPPEAERTGTRKLVLFVALFVALTLAGTWWSLSRAPVRLSDLGVVLGLPMPMLVLLGALLLGIYASDVLRYRALGRAVNAPVTWRAGLDASVANFIFSNITPGSTFGVPATVYMLGRRGVPWDAAIVMTFAKAFTAASLIAAVALGFVVSGLSPFDQRFVGVVIFTTSVLVILSGLVIAGACRPASARRLLAWCVERLRARFSRAAWPTSLEQIGLHTIDRLSLLRTGGVRPLAFLAATHLLYFTIFSGIGVVLIGAFGGEIGARAFAASWVYIAFVYYLTPTPGGAGFAEATAIPFFGGLLPADQAVMMMLCFRGLTLYLHVLVGIPYLIGVGALGAIVSRAGRNTPE